MASPKLAIQAPQAFLEGRWDDAPAGPRDVPASVRLLTWNVWFGHHMFDERRDGLFAELQRRRPDVIALQEVTPALLDALLDEPWVRARYQVSATHVAAYDVVILSRLAIQRIATLDLPTSMGRRLVIAELACGLAVATMHLESTRGEVATRVAQLQIIQPVLAARYDHAALVGDMNFLPDAPREVAALDPSFVDTWPALRPDEPGYTIDTDVNIMRRLLRDRPAHQRIDRIFVRSPRWRARAIDLVGTRPIDAEGTFVSDHLGLEAVLAPDA